MKLLHLQKVHGTTIDLCGNYEWNETHNELFLVSGSVVNIINIRTSKIIKHISTNYQSFPIKCFAATNNYKYLFTIQYETNSFQPLISCIVIEDKHKYNVTLNNLLPCNDTPKTQIEHKWSSQIEAMLIKFDKMILFTSHDLLIVQIDFSEIDKLSMNALFQNETLLRVSKPKSTKSTDLNMENRCINADIIGYIRNTDTELFNVLWFDKDRFICAGNKHLSIVQINLERPHSSQQKLKFRKLKKTDTPNISATLNKINFKLGIFANACFVCMALGDTPKSKDTLFSITKQGILCTFNVEGRYLQKWVNLRMDKAYHITVSSSLLFCCGTPDKNRVFDSDSLKHLGSLPVTQTMTNSIANITRSQIINNGKKIICIYSHGNVLLWNMVKYEREKGTIHYKFNIFKSIEKNTFNDSNNQIIELANNDWIILNDKGCLKCISDQCISTTLPSNLLQNSQNISHIFISRFEDCQSLIVISRNNIASIYATNPNIKLKERINVSEMSQNEIEQISDIKVSVLSKYIAMIGVRHKNRLQIIDTLTPQNIHSIIALDAQKIIDFDFWSDETGIFIVTENGFLHSHSLDTTNKNDTNAIIDLCANEIRAIKAYPKGKFIIFISENSRKITVWNIEQSCLSRIYELPHFPNRILFDPLGLYLVVSCADFNLYFIDWFSGKIIYKGSFHISSIANIGFSHKSFDSFVTISRDGLIAKWTLPFKVTNAMKERESELNGTHSIILNSFNELKQIQLELPGGTELLEFEESVSSNVSSVEIPSLNSLALLKSIEFETCDGNSNNNTQSSNDGMKEIVQQCKILENNHSFLFGQSLIELKVIFCDDIIGIKLENDSFPIQMYITIDTNEIINASPNLFTEILINENMNIKALELFETEFDAQQTILNYIQKSEINSEKTTEIINNGESVESEEVAILNYIQKSEIMSSTKKIQIYCDHNNAEESSQSKNNSNSEEVALILSCIESNLLNFSEQIHSLSLLLKLHKVTKEDIGKRLTQNMKLKPNINLESICDSIEWITDIISRSNPV